MKFMEGEEEEEDEIEGRKGREGGRKRGRTDREIKDELDRVK